jgi:hypothetical protein
VFEEALATILSRLEAALAQRLLRAYALIGGFAVAAWGVQRATQDIEFAVAIGTKNAEELAQFLNGRYEAGGADDPLRGVIRTTVPTGSISVPVQLIVLPDTFTEAVFQQVTTLSFMNRTVPMVGWERLVILKLYAGGPQDVFDARQILKVRQPSENELRAVSDLADRLGIRAEWTALSAEHAKDQ